MRQRSDEKIETNEKTSILVLKGINYPRDQFKEFFAAPERSKYETSFVPVVHAAWNEDSVRTLGKHIVDARFEEEIFSESDYDAGYGGLVFTSRNAAEVFVDSVVRIGEYAMNSFSMDHMPIYCVGHATAQPLEALELHGPEILGQGSGNGENLAHFIRGHYPLRCEWKRWTKRPKLLFLAGEEHKDSIPRILDGPDVPQDQRIRVDVLTMYTTKVREDFVNDFSSIMRPAIVNSSIQWVVVFTKKGTEKLLDALGRLGFDYRDRGREISKAPNCYIAAIGPKTRQEMQEFDCTPDVVAEKPTAAAVHDAIEKFMSEKKMSG
ncbi:MAG: hypothetical protein Q9162_007609 [Coniocarpon cinnabarinum]